MLTSSTSTTSSALCLAVREGEIARVKNLLAAGVDPNTLDENGNLALVCVTRGDLGDSSIEIAKVLIEAGADPSLSDKDEKISAFQMSIENNIVAFLEYFVSIGIDVNKADAQGNTPIIFAAKKGNTEAVEILLKAGALINHKNNKAETVLHVLPQREYWRDNENYALVELLLNHGAQVNIADEQGKTPLFYAIKNGSPEIVKLLVEAGAEVNSALEHPYPEDKDDLSGRRFNQMILLMEESRKPIFLNTGKFDSAFLNRWTHLNNSIRSLGTMSKIDFYGFNISVLAKNIIEKGYSMSSKNSDEYLIKLADEFRDVINDRLLLNRQGKSLLADALGTYYSQGNRFDVKCVLNAKQGVLTQADEALFFEAILNQNEEIAKWFIQAGARLDLKDSRGQTPLFHAAKKGNLPLMKTLLKEGADINSKDIYGQTPLFMAVASNWVRATKFLINAGAIINVTDIHGYTPLLYAASRGTGAIVQYLLRAGADKSGLNNSGQSALFEAASNYYSEPIQILINAGLNVNISNCADLTPLHAAARKGGRAIVELLLQNGADIHAEDWCCDTPLFEAIRHAHVEIVKILLSKGANIYHVNNVGYTPVKLAKETRCEELIKIIEEAIQHTPMVSIPTLLTPRHQGDLSKNDYFNLLQFMPRVLDFLRANQFKNIEKLIEFKSKINDLNNHIPDAELMKLYAEYCLLLSARDIKTPPYNTLLVEAITAGNVKIVQHLVVLGFDVNKCSNYGGLPITCAVKLEEKQTRMELVKLLYDAGADPHPTHKTYGGSAFLLSISYNHPDLVSFFIAAGVDCNKPDSNGNSALHTAVYYCLPEIVKMLFELKALANPVNAKGETPLHLLADCYFSPNRERYHKSNAIIELFILNNVDLNIVDNRGRTPLFNLVQGGNVTGAKLLIDAGARFQVTDNTGYNLIDYAKRNDDTPMIKLLGGEIMQERAPTPPPSSSSCFGVFFRRRQNQIVPDNTQSTNTSHMTARWK